MANVDLSKPTIYCHRLCCSIHPARDLDAGLIPAADMVTSEASTSWVSIPGITRQVEQVVANFPNYAWFDAMTLHPTGDVVYWGPLFIQIISALCILAGAATRPGSWWWRPGSLR